ncbi:MAG: acyltransferase family protein, partial [Candidatus Tectomicrobia bacterium]|nr:acyltransferase family protein [Candidatus Tectomicrobia bacterium]
MYDMDALRTVAMLLGVILHSAVFLIDEDLWPVHVDTYLEGRSNERNPYAILFSAIHGFRMPVFFLISGFFAAMLLEKRGLGRMAMHRMKRLALPFAIAALTIVPLTSRLLLGDALDLPWWPIAWVDHLWHIWFLWYLMLLT